MNPDPPVVFGVFMFWLLCALVSSAASLEEVQTVVHDSELYRPHLISEYASTFPADVYAQAASGKIVTGLDPVPGQTIRKAWAVGVIQSDVRTVWAALRDFGLRSDYSRVGYSELQTGEACVSGRTVFQHLPVPMLSDRWWVSKLTHSDALEVNSGGKAFELSFVASTDESGLRTASARAWSKKAVPIASSQGAYFIYAVNDHETLVEYHLMSDPGGYVPSSLANAFATGGVRDSLEALAKLSHDGSRCPKQ
ncbi:MAG: hypothetical protein ACI9MC_002303 [Kiritimatiellia bacterium]|jgi:hypothetical protein